MRELWGLVLVVLSGGGAGLAAAARLRRNVRLSEALCTAAERMRCRVCLSRSPIPLVLRELPALCPELFSPGNMARLDSWDDLFSALEAPEGLLRPIRELRDDLSLGMEPERAFSLCIHELETQKRWMRDRQARSGRLYVTLGFTVGAMAAVLFA